MHIRSLPGGTTPCCQNTGPYPDLFCGQWLTIDTETGSNTPICGELLIKTTATVELNGNIIYTTFSRNII